MPWSELINKISRAFVLSLIPFSLQAETSSRSTHGFFNAGLLEPGEWELAPVTGFKVGASETLELGILPYASLKAIPNLFLKHKMFHTESVDISFTSYSQWQPFKGLKEYEFISLHGIAVTAPGLLENLLLNAGPARAYFVLKREKDEVESILELGIYSLFAGFDYRFSSEWTLSGLLLVPVTTFQDITSEEGDESRSINNIAKIRQGSPNYVSYLTIMRSWDSFHLDLGVFRAYNLVSPYVNLIWRFR